MIAFTRSLASVFRRAHKQAVPYTPPRNPVRGILVNGQMRSIAELRSDYGRGIRLTMGSIAEIASGDYSKEELALAYKTGETAFIGINVRAGISSEIPIHVVNAMGDECLDTSAQHIIDNAPQIIWALMAHSCIWGLRYIWKRRNKSYNGNGKGYPSQLRVLSPLDVTPELDYTNNTVRRYRYQLGGTLRYIDPCDMIVDVTFNPFSDVDGTSALEIAKVRSDIETNIGRYGAMFFANSARPDLLITTSAELDEKQQAEARNSFDKQFKGVFNTFRAWFAAGADWKVENISTNPVDLAMTELTNQADMKILAALRVNPILAGIGSAADPLSAQGTYEQVRRTHIDFVAIPDVRAICNILNEQWLSVDFPGQTWRLEPDLSAIQSDSLGTGDRVATATGAVAQHVWSVNEARQYTGKEPLPHVIGFNPDWANGMYSSGLLKHRQALLAVGYDPKTVSVGDEYHPAIEQAKTADLNSQLTSGAIMLNEYRRAKRLPELPNGNILYVPSGVVQTPLDKLGQMPAPQPPTPPSFPFGNSSPPQLPRHYERALQSLVDDMPPAGSDMLPETLAQLHELGLWSKRVKKSGPTARFKAEVLPERVVTWVRASLDAQWPSADVFGAAREWVRIGGNEPQLGADRQEAEEYWRDFNNIKEAIGDPFIDYLKAVSPELYTLALDGQQIPNEVFAKYQDALIKAWVGTIEEPGLLTKLLIAGQAAGDTMLQRGSALKPGKTRSLSLEVNWALVSQDALKFAQDYAFNLIKGLNQTTTDEIRAAQERQISEGLSRDDFASLLEDILIREGSTPAERIRQRAEAISQTESVRLYNEGAWQRWGAAGVTEAVWQTVNDGVYPNGHVCQRCASVNGVQANIRDGWYSAVDGEILRPPRHTGCRCYTRPVTRG